MKAKHVRKRPVRFLLKFLVVVICLSGFLFQTSEFMFLFWTYPTVVDIQVSVPTEIEVPGITFCNPNGMNLEAFCRLSARCSRASMLLFINYCITYKEFCIDGSVIPDGFIAPRYERLTKNVDLNDSSLNMLRLPWEDFFTCTISTGVGSIPRYCENKPSVLHGHIVQKSKYRIEVQLPKYSPADVPTSVQIAIHSADMTVSPYIFGKGFLGGKNYRIKLKKNENHLLPPPYQTNCTDYLKDWKVRSGMAPLNQFMVVQECRKNISVVDSGCVPYDVDYPHNLTLCKFCPLCDNRTRSGENCTDVLSGYNQPCDSSEYLMNIEELWVYEIRIMQGTFIAKQETSMFRQKGHDCKGQNVFMKRCQITNIEIDFDEFQVTNISYNPKFEDLEVFSVVGGYMGMYLGISLVAIYDFLETALSATVVFLKKYRRKKKINQVQGMKTAKRDEDKRNRLSDGLRKRNTLSSWAYSVY